MSAASLLWLVASAATIVAVLWLARWLDHGAAL